MYSFAQRPDTIVFDEPLYAHYLINSGIDHPGKEAILLSQLQDGNAVVNEIILKNYEKPVSFFKQMTHHLIHLNEDFLSLVKHIIFIRNPKQIISSYAAVRPDVTMQDIGIAKQWELFKRLREINANPIVLDSGELLKQPEQVLRLLCNALEIPFHQQMLFWPAGPKREDGVWAEFWYRNVHRSTGFEKQSTSERLLPDYLEGLYAESKIFYDKLIPFSIKA